MFIEPEVLGPDDKWYCPYCKEHMQAEKKMSVWRLPPILIIHLKRFKYYHGSSFGYLSDSRVKIDTTVKFPVQYVFKIKISFKDKILLIVILTWDHTVLQQQIHLNLVMIYLGLSIIVVVHGSDIIHLMQDFYLTMIRLKQKLVKEISFFYKNNFHLFFRLEKFR
jgi:hypothetical protein